MIQIKPTQYGRGRIASQIEINILTFSTTAINCQTLWKVFDSDNKELEFGNTLVPEDIYTDWGQQNEFVEDYILEQLQLERL